MIEKLFEGAYRRNDLEKVQIPSKRKKKKTLHRLNRSTCYILWCKYSYSKQRVVAGTIWGGGGGGFSWHALCPTLWLSWGARVRSVASRSQ